MFLQNCQSTIHRFVRGLISVSFEQSYRLDLRLLSLFRIDCLTACQWGIGFCSFFSIITQHYHKSFPTLRRLVTTRIQHILFEGWRHVTSKLTVRRNKGTTVAFLSLVNEGVALLAEKKGGRVHFGIKRLFYSTNCDKCRDQMVARICIWIVIGCLKESNLFFSNGQIYTWNFAFIYFAILHRDLSNCNF